MTGTVNDPQKTPLYDAHMELGAKIVDFNGWLMPVQYESIIREHETVRSTAGVFDISHMGEFYLTGPDVIPLLQSLMVNDLRLMERGKGQYSTMCYPNGTVVDDLFYYEEDPGHFRMIVNAGNVKKDFEWIKGHIGERDVNLQDLSGQRARIAFQGPKSDAYLQPLVDVDLASIKRFFIASGKLGEIPTFIARTGYTGEPGVEISFPREFARQVWDILLETGASPIGLGARDSLRLEACYALYGHEISEKITPVEAGMGWVVKPKEGIDFIGKQVLLRQKAEGTEYTSAGLNLVDRGIIRDGYRLFQDGVEVGYVTSGGYSPTLKKTIGLAHIKVEASTVGKELEIEIRNKKLRAVVVETPFYRNI